MVYVLRDWITNGLIAISIYTEFVSAKLHVFICTGLPGIKLFRENVVVIMKKLLLCSVFALI